MQQSTGTGLTDLYPIPDYGNIVDVVPEGKQGIAEVQHFDITPIEAKTHNRENQNPELHVSPGRFARLMLNGELNMSDTDMERKTNARFIHRARGNVLCFGLGLGLVLRPLLLKREVESIRIVEKEQDVLDIVGEHYGQRKLKIVQGDAFTYETPDKFNTIYFDIWGKLGSEQMFHEQQELQVRYRQFLKHNGDNWMDSWYRKETEDKYGF